MRWAMCPWVCCLGAGWRVCLHTHLICCKCSHIQYAGCWMASGHSCFQTNPSTSHLYSSFCDTCPWFETFMGWVLLCVPLVPFSLKCAAQCKLTDRYPFYESSAWSKRECWPPPGPWSQRCLSLLNSSVPPFHCPFDDALTKAKKGRQLWAPFSQETGEVPLLLLV